MKYMSITVALAMVIGVSACSTQGTTTNSAAPAPIAAVPRETVLLVSLDDGSVIKQTIYSAADFCFKMNSASSTTCLTQGAPILDPATNSVVGFQMIEDHIELVARSE